MLDRLMDFSRESESAEVFASPLPGTLDRGSAVRDVVDANSRNRNRTGSVPLERREGDGTGNWDSGRIAQICQNLIVNAPATYLVAKMARLSHCEASTDNEVRLRFNNDGEPYKSEMPNCRRNIRAFPERGDKPNQQRPLGTWALGPILVKELARE